MKIENLCDYSIPAISIEICIINGLSGATSGKELTCQCRRHKRYGFNPWVGKIPWRGDPLEDGMATHSSILAWRIPWIEEPGKLQSMGVANHWT